MQYGKLEDESAVPTAPTGFSKADIEAGVIIMASRHRNTY